MSDHGQTNDAAPTSLFERMSALARGNEDAMARAKAHLGTAESLPPHDAETGEIIEERPADEPAPEPEPITTPPPPPQPEPAPTIEVRPEAQKQELIEPRHEPWAASSMGSVIDMMERGQFSQEALKAMMALGQGMTEMAARIGKRQKGKLVITLNLTTESEAFFIEGDFKVTAPKEPRPRTMAWQDDTGRFMPSMPKQKLLFGVAGTEHGPRVVGDSREIRTI